MPGPLTVSAVLVKVIHCLSQKLRHSHIQSQKYFSNLLTAPKPHHHCPNHSPSSCHHCPRPNHFRLQSCFSPSHSDLFKQKPPSLIVPTAPQNPSSKTQKCLGHCLSNCRDLLSSRNVELIPVPGLATALSHSCHHTHAFYPSLQPSRNLLRT